MRNSESGCKKRWRNSNGSGHRNRKGHNLEIHKEAQKTLNKAISAIKSIVGSNTVSNLVVDYTATVKTESHITKQTGIKYTI